MIEEERIKKGNNHNTRKWCKGRKPVRYEFEFYKDISLPPYWYMHQYRCKACGRIIFKDVKEKR